MGNTIYTPQILLKKLKFLQRLMAQTVLKASHALEAESKAFAGQIVTNGIADVVQIHYVSVDLDITELLNQIENVVPSANVLLYPPVVKKGSTTDIEDVGKVVATIKLDITTNPDRFGAYNKYGVVIPGIWSEFVSGDVFEVSGSGLNNNGVYYTATNTPAAGSYLEVADGEIPSNEESGSLQVRLLERP